MLSELDNDQHSEQSVCFVVSVVSVEGSDCLPLNCILL